MLELRGERSENPGKSSASGYGKTRSDVDTRCNNQIPIRQADAGDGYVDVTDPTHPLYQRKFEILFVSRGDCGTAFVTVRYRGDSATRIPLHSTSLSDLGQDAIRSKLTARAGAELLALVKEYELCPRQPRKSGATSRPRRGAKSSKNSTASSRR